MKSIYLSFMSGVCGGLGAFLTKIFVPNNPIDISLWINNPGWSLSILLGVASFLFMQEALKKEKAHIVMGVMMSVIVIVSIICGVIFLGERISYLGVLAIAFVLIGIITINR
ncbi:MAG: EamA family transporter [Nanoarchaeota archaeon]|nr:EamA family transporter [Nanoarchaeota archaeon]